MQIRKLLFGLGCLLVVLLAPHVSRAQPPLHAWSKGFGDTSAQDARSVATDNSGNAVITGTLTGSTDFGGGALNSAGLGDIYVAKFDVVGHHLWSKRFGDAGNQIGRAVSVDASGNIYIAGYYDGTVDFGGGSLTSAGGFDIYIVKFNPEGDHIWSKRFGDTSSDWAYAVAVDASGNVVVAGTFTGSIDFGGGLLTASGSTDICVVKLDSAGNHIWSDRFGDGSSNYGLGVTADASGNVIATGQFVSTVDFGGGVLTSAGNSDIFIAKFAATGDHIWSERFGDSSSQIGMKVKTDSDGNVIAVGHFQGTVDFGGGPLTSPGLFDIYIAKFDPTGTHMWSLGFGDSQLQYGKGVSVDNLDNVIIAGDFEGTVDFGGGPLTSLGDRDIYVAKFDAAGNHLWSDSFGGSGPHYAEGVTTDGSGDVILVGECWNTVDFGGGQLPHAGMYDVYVARFDKAGNHVWSQSFGGELHQWGMGVAADGFGNVILTGHFGDTVDFGGGPLTDAGLSDIYIARFWQAAPRIACVRDVPGDQGGWINLCWDGSGMDNPVEHAITNYTLWRAISPAAASSMLEAGATAVDHPVAGAWSAADTDNPLIRLQQLEGMTYYWYLVNTVTAYYLPGYSSPVETLFDSTSVSTELHHFQVIAHTADPYTFYTSAPGSGYSVDNLAPAAPLYLVGEQTVSPEGLILSWQDNSEEDLAGYAVYRGTSPTFDPDPGNRIDDPADNTTTDAGWTWDSGYYYKVSALDLHGNESGYALLGPNLVTDAGGTPAPAKTYLAQNYPNPFRRSTQISFGLAEATDVSLRVYDVKGRLVRVLSQGNLEAQVHDVQWDGRGARGERVASGVYFYYLTAGERTHIRKMVLLR